MAEHCAFHPMTFFFFWRALQLDIDAGLLTKQLDLLRNWLRRPGTLPLSIRMAYRATGELDASIVGLAELCAQILGFKLEKPPDLQNSDQWELTKLPDRQIWVEPWSR
ncbi:hypothetical protein B0H13DRAFT_1936383 [Mycena leptocephala]|nr:hypothetical protein B0H13DRAFT_1936383 [Mycena leptocephala]